MNRLGIRLAGIGGAASALGALAASACCSIPLALSIAGFSTGTIALLDPLHQIRPFLLGLAVATLAAGWVMVAVRPISRSLIILTLLGIGTAMLIASLTWEYWDPVATRFLLGNGRQ